MPFGAVWAKGKQSTASTKVGTKLKAKAPSTRKPGKRKRIRLSKRSRLVGKSAALKKSLKKKSVAPFQLAKPKTKEEAKAIKRLKRKLNRFLRWGRLRRAKMGVIVMDTEGRVLYAKNAARGYIPASNLKLITIAIGLKVLGYHHRFKTKVYASNDIDPNGVLDGNLYIEGGGDPSFRSEELWRIARDLRMKGLKHVRGRVYFDVKAFDRKRFGAGWTDHSNQPREKYRPYLAPIGGLALNYSTIAVSVRPAQKVGDPARVMIDPKSYYIKKIVNKTKTTMGGRFRVRFRILPYRGYRDIVEIRGTVPLRANVKSFWRRINFPGWYAAFQFASVLRKEGIRVSGWPKRGKVPVKAKLLYTHFSPPLGQILQYAGKQSSNFTSEQVLKAVGAKRYGEPGTWKKGIRAVQEYLSTFGIKPSQYVMINGSGLGRANRLSPYQLATVLRMMLKDYRIRSEYLAAQATSGVDGTLHWRMRDRVSLGKIRGKTGTLDGVSSLSGYVLTRNKKMLVFSVLMNGRLRQGRYFRKTQNKIGRALARYPRP
jgi:D-alanyl-D-alanine carboxypeptidase/D-alanyl-D-alanine-endopeptidase (penicillin-binding protein 4)